MFWEEMTFEKFQDGCHGGHLGYHKGTILASLILHVALMPPTLFDSIGHVIQKMFEEFQGDCNGGHLGYLYQNGTI